MDFYGRNVSETQQKSIAKLTDYSKHLPDHDKIEYERLLSRKFPDFEIDRDVSVQDYWLKKRESNNANWDFLVSLIKLWERNSKEIQVNLGGKKSSASKIFVKDLNNFKTLWSRSHKEKEAVIRSQLGEANQFEKLLREKGMRLTDILEALESRK